MKYLVRFTIALPFIYIILALIINGVSASNAKKNHPKEIRIVVKEQSGSTEDGIRKFQGPCGDYCILYDGNKFEITGECGRVYDSVVYEPDTNTLYFTQ